MCIKTAINAQLKCLIVRLTRLKKLFQTTLIISYQKDNYYDYIARVEKSTCLILCYFSVEYYTLSMLL